LESGANTYLEPLEPGELAFLQHKEQKERKVYITIYVFLLVASFLFPFITSWTRFRDSEVMVFSYQKFFLSLGILLFITSFSVYVVFRNYLRRIQLDIKHKTKTISGHKILKKVVVTVKPAYHFYINSTEKLSIEVSQEDFGMYNEGDEIYVEFATYSREYFGYF